MPLLSRSQGPGMGGRSATSESELIANRGPVEHDDRGGGGVVIITGHVIDAKDAVVVQVLYL